MIFSSCVKVEINHVIDAVEEVNTVTLQLKSSDVIVTKADGDYDENTVENIINGFQCFFVDADNKIFYYTGILDPDPDGSDGVVSKVENYKLEIPSDDFEKIKNGCKLYVIANNNQITLDEDPVLSELLSKDANDLVSTPESFVMIGHQDVEANTDGNVVGTVELSRLAAKIKVTVNLDKTVTIGEEEWTSDPHAEVGTSIQFVGKSKTYLTAATSNTDLSQAPSLNVENVMENGEVIGYTLTQEVPFYTYPMSWNSESQKYIKLYIPWKTGDGSYARYEYQIPVNFDGMTLQSNYFYDITVNVGVVGGFTEPAVLKPSYYVLNWGTGQVNADLSRPKYLVVSENYVEIYNQSAYNISYFASDPVTVTITSVKFDSYRYATTRNITITKDETTVYKEETPPTSDDEFTVNDKWSDYTITNNPDDDTNDGNFDFSHIMLENTFVPHYIYITVSTEFFTENVTIVQYPPIYLKGDHSNGTVFINGSSTSARDDNRNSLGSIATGVSGSDTKVNDNQNMYNVYISSLPASNPSVIGDPRTEDGSTLTGIGKLSNYRPTRSGAENVIAPAFKVASSWGKTTDLGSYATAEKRCAAYQESGYPAGRWRVPTPAEIAFIQERSANKDIPSLFNGANNGSNWNPKWSGYWTAYGLAYWPGYNSSQQTVGPAAGAYETTDLNCGEHAVRCVYDIWYWGEDRVQSALTTAQWGDAKQNSDF